LTVHGTPKTPIWVAYNGKIADITHADTNKHTLDLAAALSESRKIVAVMVFPLRISGSGNMLIYPNEGTTGQSTGGTTQYMRGLAILAEGTNRLQYALDTANDDWDLYCFGYIVERA